MNWLKAWDTLQTARNVQDGKPVAKNARLVLVDKERRTVALRLYSTNVLTWFADGSIELYWGSWDTVITRRYINDYLPFGRLYRDRGQTYFGYNASEGGFVRVPLDGERFRILSCKWFLETFGTNGQGRTGTNWKALTERVRG